MKSPSADRYASEVGDTAPAASVGDSYDRNSQRYLDHVGSELEHASVARASLRLFAELVCPGATTLDAGCGPGHVSAFLASNGLNVCGIDISPKMIDLARAGFPDIAFQAGHMADLPVDNCSVEAVVSRHSVIHTDPERLGEVFAEFARVLTPGGRLFLSFFAADHVRDHGQAFDHAVCTAYQLDPNCISELLAGYGLEEEVRLVRRPRADERQIPHATLFARRVGALVD